MLMLAFRCEVRRFFVCLGDASVYAWCRAVFCELGFGKVD